jgi:hypothetical protein
MDWSVWYYPQVPVEMKTLDFVPRSPAAAAAAAAAAMCVCAGQRVERNTRVVALASN